MSFFDEIIVIDTKFDIKTYPLKPNMEAPGT